MISSEAHATAGGGGRVWCWWWLAWRGSGIATSVGLHWMMRMWKKKMEDMIVNIIEKPIVERSDILPKYDRNRIGLKEGAVSDIYFLKCERDIMMIPCFFSPPSLKTLESLA